jgi:hypothetical protein
LKGDVDAASLVLHADYALVLVHPAPARVEREEWLRTLPDYVITEWNVRESAWDIRGDMATNLQLVEQTAVVLGVDRSGPFALTDTWLRDSDGIWRVWRRHSTPLRAGEWGPNDVTNWTFTSRNGVTPDASIRQPSFDARAAAEQIGSTRHAERDRRPSRGGRRQQPAVLNFLGADPWEQ